MNPEYFASHCLRYFSEVNLQDPESNINLTEPHFNRSHGDKEETAVKTVVLSS